MPTPLFFPADAHEGPVWVPAQNRLYYATSVHPDGRCPADLEYLDFSAYLQDDKTLADLPEEVQCVVRPLTVEVNNHRFLAPAKQIPSSPHYIFFPNIAPQIPPSYAEPLRHYRPQTHDRRRPLPRPARRRRNGKGFGHYFW